jgi:hypothetical protein
VTPPGSLPGSKGHPVQNKTLITVTAIVALVALGVSVLALAIL